jgi:iron complex outermembrane recepter protein
VDWKLGGHDIEAGLWWEHINSQTDRNWFPFAAANHDLSPYDVPVNPAFTQYESRISNNVVVAHLQDQWRVRPDLLVTAGFKSSLQFASGKVPIQQNNTNLPKGAVPNFLPTGEIDTKVAFLPELGAAWDFNANGQAFFNIQKNVRQFITYGASGLSPWSLGSQAAFDLFKGTAKPETSWTYEAGLRGHQALGFGFLTSVEGQASVYHVDFSNRLLQISQFNFINPNPSVLANVGNVTTDGVDLAGTLHFGQHLSLYDALSYNRSIYGSDYLNNGATVHTKGKWVLDSPDWLNKTVASANFGPFEGQLIGDYVGRRYATYLNDLRADGCFTLELEASWRLAPVWALKAPKVSLNVTNLTNVKGVSSFGNTNVSGSYTAFPLPPTQGFLTLSSTF